MNANGRAAQGRPDNGAADGPNNAFGTRGRQNARHVVVGTLILAAVAGLLMGAAAAVLIGGVHPRERESATALTTVELEALIKAARPMAASLLTFGSETLDDDVAETASLATPPFAHRYRQLLDTEVRSAIADTSLQSTAQVVEAGVLEADADSASLLLFIRQIATLPGQPRSVSLTAVEVRVARANRGWRIAGLQPIIPEGSS